MNKKYNRLTTLVFLCSIQIFSLKNVIADEVWNSNYGQVIYAEDVGVTAYWTYNYKDKPGIIFIPGLAGMYDNRGDYEGYWAQNTSDERCEYPRPGLQGKPTYYWGKFHIEFLDIAFPARWAAHWGYCDALANELWEGFPIVGDAK